MAAPVLQFKRGLLTNLPGLRAGEPGFTTDSYDLYVGVSSQTSTNKFFGSHRYWTKETTSTGSGINLVEGTSNGSDFITLAAPATVGAAVTYYFPASQGAPSSVLTNDGSGNLSWASGSNNATFTGITTFSDTTDNTLGNENTGAVQLDGGMGIAKNLTVKQNLHVGGYSEFVGVVTFKGGTINIGDGDTDNINVVGEFVSNLVPNADDTYDIGIGGKRWRNTNFSGIGTFATGLVADGVQIGITGANVIDTVSGNLTLNSAGGQTIIDDFVTIQNNLTVNGNVTIGGTTVTLIGQDVFISNKDIVLGYTTSVGGQDASNDTTANHGGVAIASTVGTPLVSFSASGINTLPDTYKQLMWFKNGTLGFSTDAFAFNYGVAIGTTTMASGIRLAVGTGVTISDTAISATNFYGAFSGNASSADQVKTVTASDLNATHHITFVNSHNGSPTNETVYTDDGIYYNPGTNTFTTQHADFTGNVTVQGTLTGTASTATRAITVDTTSTSTNADFFVPFVDTLAGQNGETVRVGAGLSLNPSTGDVKITGDLQIFGNDIKASDGSTNITLASNTLTTFAGDIRVNGNDIQASDGNTNITMTSNTLTEVKGNLQVTGNIIQSSTGATVATLSANDVTFADDVTVSGNLYVNGNTTQVNTSSITVEDRTIELGVVDGNAPSSTTTWDLGVLFNYYQTSAKKSAVIWEQADSRFKFGSEISDGGGTGVDAPQITFTSYAAIEIGSLWINDCAGQSQVINCSDGVRTLENITIDAGTF